MLDINFYNSNFIAASNGCRTPHFSRAAARLRRDWNVGKKGAKIISSGVYCLLFSGYPAFFAFYKSLWKMDIVFEILLFCIEVIGTMDQYQINLMIFLWTQQICQKNWQYTRNFRVNNKCLSVLLIYDILLKVRYSFVTLCGTYFNNGGREWIWRKEVSLKNYV